MKLSFFTISAVTGAFTVLYFLYRKKKQSSNTKPNSMPIYLEPQDIEISATTVTMHTIVDEKLPEKPLIQSSSDNEETASEGGSFKDELPECLLGESMSFPEIDSSLAAVTLDDVAAAPTVECKKESSSSHTGSTRTTSPENDPTVDDSAVEMVAEKKPQQTHRMKKKKKSKGKRVNLWHAEKNRPASHTTEESGRGSDGNACTDMNHEIIEFIFQIDEELVARLIGRKGAFIKKVAKDANVKCVIQQGRDATHKLYNMAGTTLAVDIGLSIIRKSFPLDNFPNLSLEHVGIPFVVPPPIDLRHEFELNVGKLRPVRICNVASACEVWINFREHPTYAEFLKMQTNMNAFYGDGTQAPQPALPVPRNSICVVYVEPNWQRCQIISSDKDNSIITLMDHGGTVSSPNSLLRQISPQFMEVPFQATQCFVYGIQPLTSKGWLPEACEIVEKFSRNTKIYYSLEAWSQDSVPVIRLIDYNLPTTDLTETLIASGFVKKTEYAPL